MEAPADQTRKVPPPPASQDPSPWDQRMRAGETVWGAKWLVRGRVNEATCHCVLAGDPERVGL